MFPQKKGLLMVICDSCSNPMQIPSYIEPLLFVKDHLECPECGYENPVEEDLLEYVLETGDVK